MKMILRTHAVIILLAVLLITGLVSAANINLRRGDWYSLYALQKRGGCTNPSRCTDQYNPIICTSHEDCCCQEGTNFECWAVPGNCIAGGPSAPGFCIQELVGCKK